MPTAGKTTAARTASPKPASRIGRTWRSQYGECQTRFQQARPFFVAADYEPPEVAESRPEKPTPPGLVSARLRQMERKTANLRGGSFELLQRGNLRLQLGADLLELPALLRLHLLQIFYGRQPGCR